MIRASVVLIAMVLGVSAQAQQSERMQPPQGESRPDEAAYYFYQAVNLIADDSTKSRVDIPYRIDEQFFIAVKNSDPKFRFPFKRRGEVSLELLDKDGVSKARGTNRFEIGATKSESTPEEKSWYESFESFNVAPGEYTIVFEIVDLESERTHLEKNRKLTVKHFDGAKLEASTPLFLRKEKNQGSNTLIPVNFGGNLLFGKDAAVFIQLHSSNLSNSPVRIEYSISTQTFMSKEPQVIAADTIESMQLLRTATPVKDKEAVSYKLTASRSNSRAAAILLPLHADKLPLRPFMLDMKIKQGSLETVVHVPFRMVWPEMPGSLRDIDFALDALKYITREDELDSLRSGPRETRLRHLEDYWKTKDRTPNTAYNEVMEEYYRRVDYAMRTFGSLRGTDGFKTDRGRIYILHGPPSKIDRALDPAAGYQEIWMYERQGKKFVFVDKTKSGNYNLVSTQNL